MCRSASYKERTLKYHHLTLEVSGVCIENLSRVLQYKLEAADENRVNIC